MVVEVGGPEVDAHVKEEEQVDGPVKTLHRIATLGQVEEEGVEEEEGDEGLRHKVWIAKP